MAAGEAENPRVVMPRAFNAVFYRLTAFFVLGSLAVGILVPYNDAEMSDAFSTGKPGAAASPYVVAMNRMKIRVLPDIVNAMVLTAAVSKIPLLQRFICVLKTCMANALSSSVFNCVYSRSSQLFKGSH